MQLTHTISLIEVIWTCGCLPGLFFNFRIARLAAGDLATLKLKRINSLREFSAVTSLALFAYLAFAQFTFVLAGILAMLAPNRNGGASPAAFGLTAIFLILSVTSSMVGYTVDKRRRYLRDMIKTLEDGEEHEKAREITHG